MKRGWGRLSSGGGREATPGRPPPAAEGDRRRLQVGPPVAREVLPGPRPAQLAGPFAVHGERPPTALHGGPPEPVEAPPPGVVPPEQGGDRPGPRHRRGPDLAARGDQAATGG